MLISTALLLDSNIRNSVCTPAKLPCRQVVEGNKVVMSFILKLLSSPYCVASEHKRQLNPLII
jgi:hypothetical protein